MINSEPEKKHFEDAMRYFTGDREVPFFGVTYYPYVNSNHTIRVRDSRILVRISDSFQKAPSSVHRALAFILVGKLLRKRVPDSFLDEYKGFVQSDDYYEIALANKVSRSKKKTTSPTGARFDLGELFHRLNSAYFDGDLEEPTLSWSEKRTFRRLGHYDSSHNTIVVSRSLDAEGVPEYVVAFVLYHEMLHIVHEPIFRNGRRYAHTKAFRDDERIFEFYYEAEEWIERNAGKLKEYATRGY